MPCQKIERNRRLICSKDADIGGCDVDFVHRQLQVSLMASIGTALGLGFTKLMYKVKSHVISHIDCEGISC